MKQIKTHWTNFSQNWHKTLLGKGNSNLFKEEWDLSFS